MPVTVGVARHPLTPPWGVELAGFGYYLGRTWQRIRDDLTATALVVDDGRNQAALVAVDLMYIDAEFSRIVRQLAAAIPRFTNQWIFLPRIKCSLCPAIHPTT